MPLHLHLDTDVEPIAGYTLVRPLGQGGFGEVWEATAPGEVHVALKFIRLNTSQAGLEQRALEVIRNVRHPHLLDVQFATRVGDCLVIAMPLCDESLMDRLNACQAKGLPGVPRDELLGYMEELARAVDFLNEPRPQAGDSVGRVGIQHRDIKPHNIFLVGGSVRLADFGLAKVLAANIASHTGSMSPNYVAPEVVEGRVSQRSDQYSLAVTYVHVRTGHLPFTGETVHQILYAHVHKSPDLSGLADEERLVVARAMEKRPEDRWTSCRAFVLSLQAAVRTDDSRRAPPGGSPLKPGDSAEPSTVDATKLPSAKGPPPIPPEVAAGDGPSPVETAAMARRGPWPRHIGLAGLAAVLAGLAVAGVIVIPRLRPTLRSDQRAGEAGKVEPNQPAVQADPPARLEEVEARDAPASLPSKPGVTDRVRITRPIDLAPPRPALPGEPPVIASKLGLKLALIPAGEFPMGSSDEDREAGDDEKARHLVRITRPFYLGVCEVSQREYEQVMGRNPSCYSPAGKMRDKVVSHDTWRYPVENVSWNDAIAFCNALSLREGFKPYYRFGAGARSGGEGYRLPTEAEWEYASRAGSTTRYGFGDDAKRLDESAWFDGNSSERTHPVGQKRPNAFGLFDMHGNVGEWCWDGYEARYDANPTVDDPVGPSRATLRVFRGGSWADIPRGTRSTSRYGRLPDYRSDDLGFRVARDAPGR